MKSRKQKITASPRKEIKRYGKRFIASEETPLVASISGHESLFNPNVTGNSLPITGSSSFPSAVVSGTVSVTFW